MELLIKGYDESQLCKGPIIIDYDVWIGYDVTILSGVHIGEGAVIGAGTVVAKDVETYSICSRQSLLHSKKRFSDDVIKKLLTVDYSKLNIQTLESLNKISIDEKNIDWIIKNFFSE